MRKILFYLLLLISSVSIGQTSIANKLKITAAIKDNLATRVMVQDSLTGELKWVLKNSLGTVKSVTGTSGVTVALGTSTPVIGLGAITPTSTNGVSATTMAYNDATSSIQTQLNGKQPSGTYATGTGTASGTNTGDNAVNSLYSGLVSNATHTGDATGATALTVKGINGTLLSGLATGILKNTTTTGVPSIAIASDFPTLNQNTTGTASNITGVYGGTITSGQVTTALTFTPENAANKQNSLTVDGSGVKYSTVDAVNAGLATKQNTITNPVTGTGAGTTNTIPIFTGVNALGDSSLSDNGTAVNISTSNAKLTGGGTTGKMSVSNSSSTSYIEMYGQTHATIPNDITLITNATGRVRFFTTATERASFLANGNFLLGTTIDNNATLNIGKNITGAATSFGTTSRGMIQSDVTSAAYYNYTAANTQATTFTTSTLGHYVATQGTFGAGSTVTTQYGFGASATIAGATNNYGFTGNLVAGTNNYNLYMSGTAKNYLAGSLLVGTTTDDGTNKFQVSGSGIFNNSLTLNNPKDGTWTAGEVLSTLDFKGNDLSGDGVGTKAYVRALSRDTFGGAFHLTFGTDDSASGVLERMRIMDSGNILMGTTTDSGNKLRVNGTVRFDDLASGTTTQMVTADLNGVLGFQALPSGGGATNLAYTASGTNGIVASDTGTDATIPLADGTNAGLLSPSGFTDLSNAVLTNNNQTITGLKTFDRSATNPSSGINLSVGTGSGSVLAASTTGSNTAVSFSTSSSGIATNVSSSSTGTALNVRTTSSGLGLVVNSDTGSTGNPFTIQNAGVETYTLSKTGDINATKLYSVQVTPTAKTATATLTIAEILTNITTVTSTTAVTLTLPTGTLTDAGVQSGTLAVNESFEWTVINLGSSSGAVTMAAGTGHTYVGAASVAIGTSATFRTRKTAANTFVTYRI